MNKLSAVVNIVSISLCVVIMVAVIFTERDFHTITGKLDDKAVFVMTPDSTIEPCGEILRSMESHVYWKYKDDNFEHGVPSTYRFYDKN